jgi:ribosomal-protein-alanine N-acetyltransferase
VTPLKTQRLRLEPLERRHADLLFDGLQDERLYEFITDAPPVSIGALRERYARLASGQSPDCTQRWLNWAVWSLGARKYIGYVQATIAGGTATIAYLTFVDEWGKGYSHEATQAMIDYLAHQERIEKLRATVDVRNQRSIKLLEGLGFTQIALRREAECIRGEWQDEVEYGKDLSALRR